MRGKVRLAVYSVGLDPGRVGERLGKPEDAVIAEVRNVKIARGRVDGQTEWKAKSFRPNAILIRLLGAWLTEHDGCKVAILETSRAGPGEDTMIEGVGHVNVAVVIHSDCLWRGKSSGTSCGIPAASAWPSPCQ